MENAIKHLTEALDHFRDATNTLKLGISEIERYNPSLASKMKGYILGHIEPALFTEHDFMTMSMCSLEDELENLKGEACPFCNTFDDCDCKCPNCKEIYQECGCEFEI